jgi:hypothetical protein
VKEKFKDVKFKPDSLARIEQCRAIIDDYTMQGLRLTLRQLYYQCITKNYFPNTERSYKNLGSLVSDARLAGLLDWNAIEDRVRVPRIPSEFEGLGELVNAACSSYRLPRWRNQDYYVELWVEKDALAGVLRPLASKYHVTMMVNRGYASQSAMYESAQRFIQHTEENSRNCVLLYLGDFDPSGEDMVRDIRDRLNMFGVGNLNVDKIALTMEQVEQYDPPPNPAKMTDPRAGDFVAKNGKQSWEVDALPPNILTQVITDSILTYLDMGKYEEFIAKEAADIKKLKAATEKLVKKGK